MLACMIALLVREQWGISISLIYRDLCFRMERFHQHLEAFANEKKQSYILQVR